MYSFPDIFAFISASIHTGIKRPISFLTLIIVLTLDITAKSMTGTINGHEWIDLGLSVKWATCNVGAEKPEDYGDYFAWGEPMTKSSYTASNCKTYGIRTGDIKGNPTFDAACASWGGTWRLPTKGECQELVDKCIWTWVSQEGYSGYRVTSKINGNSIFLPAAGWRYGPLSFNIGEFGNYWGATPDESNAKFACYFHFKSSVHVIGWYFRQYGYSVRPVSD